jgi:hypothetical protein
MVKSSSSSPKAIHNKIGSQASTTLTVSPMLLMLILYIYIRMTHYRLFKPIIWTCVIHQFLHTLQPRATILLCHRRATFFLCPADKIPSRAPPFSSGSSVKRISRRARHRSRSAPSLSSFSRPVQPAPCGQLLRHLSISEIALQLQMVVMRNTAGAEKLLGGSGTSLGRRSRYAMARISFCYCSSVCHNDSPW